MVGVSFLLIFIWTKRLFRNSWLWISSIVLLIYRAILFGSSPENVFEKLPFFQPSLFGLSDFTPNFLSFCLNALFIAALLHVFWSFLQSQILNGRWRRGVLVTTFFSFYLFWIALVSIIEGFVENSSIPLRIDQIFDLNIYSILTYAFIGVLFFSFFRILKLVGIELCQHNKFLPSLFSLIFISGVGYFVFEIQFGVQNFICAIFPGLFLALVALFHRGKEEPKNEFIYGLVYLFVLTSVFTSLIATLNERKEHSVRELFANQLQTDRDILTELEFEVVKKKINEDAFLKKVTGTAQNINNSDFHDALERRLFDGLWDQYEMEFYLFKEDGTSFFPGVSISEDYLNDVIKSHGLQSEVDSCVYYIADYVNQYSYLFRYKFNPSSDKSVYLYAAFKSKRIPEEIGFPRLLISENARVFQSLEKYSIAKYFNKKLITSYGDYQFPVLLNSFKIGEGINEGYLERGNYNHFFLKRVEGNFIFLSTKKSSWIDTLTAFSYLFCFYGLLLLPFLFRKKDIRANGYNFSLATKIQMVMISLVFVSLLVYGWGSGIFVRNQYNDYTNQIISEKLNSVTMEFQSKFGNGDFKTVLPNGEIESALQKFSKVFVTDINFYDRFGYLIASSRPKVYNVGLLSEQMNPSSMTAMNLRNESEFVHLEKIGNLVYSSAYQPFFDTKGELQGYLNLQHFGQQKDFESQIQRFLMAIINVFMFLLAISAVVAILVSGWLTAPLRLLQERFANVNFGKLNEPISYTKQDEIGALIKEYNRKIDELAITAQQLAQSERENAWREMAKQVAHEIKNPLTPMKLSLQHFQRIYDPENPVSREKLNQTVASLVEQIDGLTRIANEFSNFAKMPNPNEEIIDLGLLIQGVVDIFSQSERIHIYFSLPVEKIFMSADKDMLVRILNNLIKNAIQASQLGGIIEVELNKSEYITVLVKDYGSGISNETRDKLFVPYFTTKSTGTGLGLAMVKQMVELHKGSISVKSKLGESTIFKIQFPL
jgi:signal transduction histidine kinase